MDGAAAFARKGSSEEELAFLLLSPMLPGSI